MRKINKQFIVKSLVFVSGVFTCYKMATKKEKEISSMIKIFYLKKKMLENL